MNASAPEPLLALQQVTIRFGGLTAVDTFSLSLCRRELIGLIGPNGAGKTTIFNMLTGIYRPTTGRILFRNEPIDGQPAHRICRCGIARTFQNIRVFGTLSVLDNVRIGAHKSVAYGLAAAVLRSGRWHEQEREIEEQARALLSIFGLERRAAVPARSLSYGDQRRLEICRALASKPDLLLLDEPAAGMNTTEAYALMEHIHAIRDRFDLAVLLIEHNMEVVMGVCERIVVLNYGRTIAEGTPAAIRQDPHVIAAYLGEPVEDVAGAGS